MAGAAGLKIHEDWGSTPAAIRAVALGRRRHTTSRSPSTPTPSTRAASSRTRSPPSRAGRSTPTTPRAPAAATRRTCSRSSASTNVLPSSTNPTLPYGINTQAELFDMIMVCHNLNPNIPSDVAFAESRVRAETIAAENVLHDMGVISMFSSDSQAMGRVGENWLRAIQTADAMKSGRGKLPEDAAGQRQLPRPALRRQGHDQSGDHVRHLARPRLDRRRARWPTSCSGRRHSSAPSRRWSSRAG